MDKPKPKRPKRAGRFTQWNEKRRLKKAERQKIVAQLTKEEVPQKEIAKRLGVHEKTVKRDQEENLDYLNEQKLPDLEAQRAEARRRLQELEDDLENALTAGRMTMKDRITLALDILKDRRELLGLDAPRKTASVNTNLNLNASPEMLGLYDRFLREGAGLEPSQFESAFMLLRETPRKKPEGARPPADSPLWHQGEKKALPE